MRVETHSLSPSKKETLREYASEGLRDANDAFPSTSTYSCQVNAGLGTVVTHIVEVAMAFRLRS